ncbi:MAG: PIN domain-containing protein [Oscillospiraceae bacterium]|nr:PIN domain-containing protein [Oscillospiraceae bacterium]
MSVFLVDYENVTSAGLAGIERLTEADSVYIFYTPNAASLSFDAHRAIMSAKPKINYISVSAGVKNALDFQLDSFLGYLTAVSEDRSFYIVSSDNGYSAVKSFWEKTMGITNAHIQIIPCIRFIFRQNIIESSALPAKDTALIRQNTAPAAEADIPETSVSDNHILPEPDTFVQPAKESKPSPAAKKAENAASNEAPSEKKPALSPETERLLVIFKAEGISNDARRSIIDLAKSSSDKQHFYTSMTKKFGMEEGLRFYKALRPEYANIRKLSPKYITDLKG